MALVAPFSHKIESIHGEQFVLNPQGEALIKQRYDYERGYAKTLRFAQSVFSRRDQCVDTNLNKHGFYPARKLIPADVCRKLIQHTQEADAAYLQTREGALNLLDAIFNPQLDAEIISHFGSEYLPLWFHISADTYQSSQDSCSFKWHCDGGPSQHLKIMVYLNSAEEHQGNTLFANPEITQAMKKIGYIFCDLNERKVDLSLLAAAHNIPLSEQGFTLQAGDALVFNPNQIMHRGKSPQMGKTRYVLHICLVPSPVHWRQAIQTIRWPSYGCWDFIDLTAQIKNAFELLDNHTPTANELLLINPNYQIHSTSYSYFILQGIFTPSITADQFLKDFTAKNGLDTQKDLLGLLTDVKLFLQKQINAQAPNPKPEMLGLMQEILAYEQGLHKKGRLYGKDNKPNPEGVFWPDPTRAGNTADLYQLMPFVNRFPFIKKTTPIGSAGSCFAFELSKQFQLEGFNYVVTERADDTSKGVIVDGHEPGAPAKFCANYGIQFNTPSFRQLAEKAFNRREFIKILSQEGPELFMDPYRENVFFTSPEAYLADYNEHIRAVREALMTCEVFIITLGLNECWEFIHDGSVMSRNPKHSMYHLVRPKVLTLQENIDNIQTFLDIVRAHNPNFKLIISLSPIPFLATHQADHKHVVEANCHSKAVLRLAAEEIVKNNPNVFYLPSYELVTHCSRDAWTEDNRHVKEEVVQRVIQMFKGMFVVA